MGGGQGEVPPIFDWRPPMAALAARRWPVRWILIGIVFGLVAPGLVFCGFLLFEFDRAQGEQIRAGALAAAARAADAVDREIGNLSVALRVLAMSPSLRAHDAAAFGAQARPVAVAIGHDIVVLDDSGQQVSATDLAPGVAPPAGVASVLHQARATHAVAVSNLLDIAREGAPMLALIMPVEEQGWAIGLYLAPAYFSKALREQALPAGWVASLVDGNGRLFARNRTAERFVGQSVGKDFAAHAASDEKVWWGTTLDGIPVLAASATVRLADWRVGVGVPSNLVQMPARNSVVLLGLVGAATLALGCVLAWQLSRLVSRPLQKLALAGQALARNEAVDPIRSPIDEVDAVSRALVKAIADLHARNAALDGERAQLAAILETVPVGLLIAEAPSGRILAGNGNLERMLRQPPLLPGAADRRVPLDAAGAPVPAAQDPLRRALAGEEHPELQCRYRRGDGTAIWVQTIGAPIRGADGRVTGAVLAVLDIDEVVRAREENARFAESLEDKVAQRTAELETVAQRLRDEIAARAEAEEQLRQVQKMEAVGRLTGGIAHDFNNMLTVVIGSLDLLRRRATEPRSIRLLDNAIQGAGRAATLTARLLAFSRQQPLMPQSIDVNRLVDGMSDLLHSTLGETIRVETVLPEDVWPVQADPNQLENALLNLAVNARDAILEAAPVGGRLTIETGNARLDQDFTLQSTDVRPGDYVVIACSDTGSGMTDDVLSRAYEPFFTTKKQGRGSGLGLSQVHGFVKQSGGHVAIATELGRGTTVRIYLPRSEENADSPAPLSLSEAMSRSGETLLVVEDEGGVRRFAAEALRELGYHVLAADGATAALRLLEAHPETALLLTDVVMAGTGGPELAAEVLRRRPGLPVLFTTGYERATMMRAGQLGPGQELIAKPFTVVELGVKVREMLGRSMAQTTAVP